MMIFLTHAHFHYDLAMVIFRVVSLFLPNMHDKGSFMAWGKIFTILYIFLKYYLNYDKRNLNHDSFPVGIFTVSDAADNNRIHGHIWPWWRRVSRTRWLYYVSIIFQFTMVCKILHERFIYYSWEDCKWLLLNVLLPCCKLCCSGPFDRIGDISFRINAHEDNVSLGCPLLLSFTRLQY